MTSQYKIRFIHQGHEDATAIPTTWIHPRSDEVFNGAQVIDLSEALEMIETGEHYGDDFFSPSNYTHVAILEVTGHSGDSGPLSYWSVTADDIESMHVIEFSDSGIKWKMMEIALELAEEGEEIEVDDMGFPFEGWWDEVGEDEVIARLIDRCEKVDPTFVEYK